MKVGDTVKGRQVTQIWPDKNKMELSFPRIGKDGKIRSVIVPIWNDSKTGGGRSK